MGRFFYIKNNKIKSKDKTVKSYELNAAWNSISKKADEKSFLPNTYHFIKQTYKLI
jgi:hypothetical protein